MGIGKNLKDIAIKKNMSIKEIAEKSGLPYGTLTNIISRDQNSVRTDTLEKLASALGVTAYELSLDEPQKFLNYAERIRQTAFISCMDQLAQYGFSYNWIDENTKIEIRKKQTIITVLSIDDVKEINECLVKYVYGCIKFENLTD